MKKVLLIFLMILTFGLYGCSKNELPDPNTNLEFWITENVDDVDWSNYQMKYGMMGGNMYYGTGYVPTLDEYNQQVDPEQCVIYTVTSYPDYSNKAQHITYIEITDPSIVFYGLSLNSTDEEIMEIMGNMDFVFQELGGDTLVAKKGKYTFSFSPSTITIRVNVTNKTGIIF